MSSGELRTKRRYAHELYPHPAEGEVRPLAVDVPYLYARAIGFDIHGTGWMNLSKERLPEAGLRTHLLINAREIALLADALYRGLTGQDAWQWAQERAHEESGEWIWQLATAHEVDPDAIKPYPCGPEPATHFHADETLANGWITQKLISCRESECPDCCEVTE